MIGLHFQPIMRNMTHRQRNTRSSSKNVKVNELSSQGDDLNEWGYRPNNQGLYTKSQLNHPLVGSAKTPTVSPSLWEQ